MISSDLHGAEFERCRVSCRDSSCSSMIGSFATVYVSVNGGNWVGEG